MNGLRKRTLKELIADFEATIDNNDEHITVVRGWIMDELEIRNSEAFDLWIDSAKDSPREFFI